MHTVLGSCTWTVLFWEIQSGLFTRCCFFTAIFHQSRTKIEQTPSLFYPLKKKVRGECSSFTRSKPQTSSSRTLRLTAAVNVDLVRLEQATPSLLSRSFASPHVCYISIAGLQSRADVTVGARWRNIFQEKFLCAAAIHSNPSEGGLWTGGQCSSERD